MTIMRAGLTLVAFVWAGMASALEPILPDNFCEGDAVGSPYEIRTYIYQSVGDGFMAYSGEEPSTGAWAMILEYCPERRQLVLRSGIGFSNSETGEDAEALFSEMVLGPENYTMDQMAAALRGLGDAVDMRRVNYESCACAHQ